MLPQAVVEMENLTPKEAVRRQRELVTEINLKPLDLQPEIVGGADLSYDKHSDLVFAGIVILSLPALKPVARSLTVYKTTFPYIPGLLAFREIPALYEAWSQSKIKPDVLIMDGHGLAHPRKMGLATHFGILIDHPTVGCAKNILVGDYTDPNKNKGEYEDIMYKEERVGIALRSRANVKPIFISPGNNINLADSLSVVQKSLGRFKLPETTRWAHRLVNELRKNKIKPGFEYLK